MGNILGRLFRVATWGESHGPALGAVIDGCPAGIPLDPGALARELERDIPDPQMGTKRREANAPEVLSGVFEGLTLGTPLSIMVRNTDVNSAAYEEIAWTPRPGHGDLTWRLRHGHVDWRGGGRASGRECISRVLAGAVAKEILNKLDITIASRIVELAGIPIKSGADMEKARLKVREVGARGDSTGGIIELTAHNVPAGIGSPVFDKLETHLAGAMMGIGGVKSFEIGAGRRSARMLGSESNDQYFLEGDEPKMHTNNSGGVLAGISTGTDLVMTMAVKPTPSIGAPQSTVDLRSKKPRTISMNGRFDKNFTPRVLVVAEAMAALVLVDYLLEAGEIHPMRFDESPLLKRRTSPLPSRAG